MKRKRSATSSGDASSTSQPPKRRKIDPDSPPDVPNSSNPPPASAPSDPVPDRTRITDAVVLENLVGIRMFLSPPPPGSSGTGSLLFGITKQRSFDFHVVEILQGRYARLRSSMDEQEGEPTEDEEQEEEGETDSLVDEFPSLIDRIGQLCRDKELGISFGTWIRQVVVDEEVENEDDGSSSVCKFEFCEMQDKSLRGRVHQAISAVVDSVVGGLSGKSTWGFESETDSQSKKIVVFRRKKSQIQRGGRRARGGGRGRKKTPKFGEFVLVKKDVDTKTALSKIASFCRTNMKRFTFCGNKDKRAVTSQFVRCARFDRDDFKKSQQRLRDVQLGQRSLLSIGSFRYETAPLRLGMLDGNRFSIVLRNVELAEGVTLGMCEQHIRTVFKNGFANYFGMQRFGTSAECFTHWVGIPILKSDWKEVVRRVLINQATIKGYCVGLREVIDAYLNEEVSPEDTLTALEAYRSAFYEKKLIRFLIRSPGNYRNAFDRVLPRTLRMLYVHAYQSYVWNVMVSNRIAHYGRRTVAGDLVFDESGAALEPSTHGGRQHIRESRKRVRVVQPEEADSIPFDKVVFPQPGCDVTYPTHEIGEDAIAELMAKDGLLLTSFVQLQKSYATYGAYRKMVVLPRNPSFSFARYESFDKPLVLSAADVLNGVESGIVDGGPKLALILEFGLCPGSYATMLIREILRVSSAQNWRNVNEG